MAGEADGGGPLSPLKRAYLALRRSQARVAELEAREARRREPIAIVGAACRLPGGASDPERFWDLLASGRDAVTELPPGRWDADDPGAPGRGAPRFGAFLDDVDGFDPRFFGISPREAESMDPQQRLVLEVAWEALEDAGLPRERLAGGDAGVFVGCTGNDHLRMQAREGDLRRIGSHAATAAAAYLLSGRLSYFLDLHGPSLTLDTACSSALVAVHQACLSLRAGECDLAVAGGVNLTLAPDGTRALARMGALSPDGRCKVFDAGADGIVRGEGCGFVVLEHFADARAAGDPVRALLRGSAVGQDGRTNGLTAPNGRAQQAVVRRALADAGLAPSQVGYVETHGTGTVLGDPIELEALGAVREGAPPCLVGSAKANIGHLEAAAGIAGLIKAVLVLERGAIPPQIHLRTLNPHLEPVAASFEIPRRLRPWPRGAEARRAGVSAFGFSGTNAHAVLEEAPSPPPAQATAPPHLVALSARSVGALAAMVEAWRAWLAGPEAPEGLSDVAFTAGVRRSVFEHRLAVVAGSPAQLDEGLAAHAAGAAAFGLAAGHGDAPGTPVFVFPAPGDAEATAGAALGERWPAFDRALRGWEAALASTSPGPGTPTPLRAVGVQVALAALWSSWGVEPDAVVGCGLGALAAAVAAGAIDVEEAARLAAARARGDAVQLRAMPRETPVAQLSPRTGEPLSGAALAAALARPGPGDADLGRAVDVLRGGGAGVFVVMGAAPGPDGDGIVPVPSLAAGRDPRESLLAAVGRAFAAGQPLRREALHPGRGRCVRLPHYPWQRRICTPRPRERAGAARPAGRARPGPVAAASSGA